MDLIPTNIYYQITTELFSNICTCVLAVTAQGPKEALVMTELWSVFYGQSLHIKTVIPRGR
jgi:hypothetical protein